MTKNKTTRMLAEAGIMIALALVLTAQLRRHVR